MNFIHFDLGQCQSGAVVEITLSAGAHVRLLDSSNFSSYRNGRNCHFIGGLARRTPVRLQIPQSGHWHVAVDMQGLRGSVRAGVRMLS
ncbi:hypothetical protein VT03_07020 [Planctomyces sp. SH-PL14]|nr:hypothetical protein VT03_07020 [Planctomyces sp. SH-PL14]